MGSEMCIRDRDAWHSSHREMCKFMQTVGMKELIQFLIDEHAEFNGFTVVFLDGTPWEGRAAVSTLANAVEFFGEVVSILDFILTDSEKAVLKQHSALVASRIRG